MGGMEASELCKMCAVPPRHLGKGAQMPPPLHPPLDIAGVRVSNPEPAIDAFSRCRSGAAWRHGPGRPGRRAKPHQEREIPLSLFNPCGRREHSRSPQNPIDQKENSLSLWTPIEHGQGSPSPCTPCDHDFRVLDHDQGRELSCSPWTVPSTSGSVAGPRLAGTVLMFAEARI